MLFRVSGTDIFIIGAIHRQPHGAVVPDRYLSAISNADLCYFEHDSSGKMLAEAGKCEGNTWFGTGVPLYVLLRTLVVYCKLGIPLGHMPWDRKPWWVAIQLNGLINESVGHSGKNSLDGQLWAFAEKSGKVPLSLDSPDLFQMFESIPVAEHISQLREIVSDPLLYQKNCQQTYEDWQRGDLAAMAASLESWLKVRPVMATKMVLDRNQLWLPKLVKTIEDGHRAVFSVGAMHLAGPKGLNALLKETPYCFNLLQL